MFTVTAWRNGPHGPNTCYGLRVALNDRAHFFRHAWDTVHLQLPNRPDAAAIPLSPSFWRSCPELRGEAIGAWLRHTGMAPWARHHPPRFVMRPTGNARFVVELP
jgi:hypothetical protein